MPLEKKLEVGALNITTHPHSPENYLRLFKSASRIKESIKLRGDQFARIGYISSVDEHKYGTNGPISGEIIKFTQIDVNGDWFDIERRDKVSDDEKAQINIPEKFKPNLAQFSFVFFPEEHILIYEGYYSGKQLSANYAESIFNQVLNKPELTKKYGNVNVNHLPEKEKVDELLNIKGITQLSIKTVRPNPDDFKSAERKVHDRLKRLHVISEEKILLANKTESIKPDKELKIEATIAAKNGEVALVNYNESGKRETHSTKSHPLRRISFYYPEVETTFSHFFSLADKIKTEVMKWIK